MSSKYVTKDSKKKLVESILPAKKKIINEIFLFQLNSRYIPTLTASNKTMLHTVASVNASRAVKQQVYILHV